jgi:hypothetical protein
MSLRKTLKSFLVYSLNSFLYKNYKVKSENPLRLRTYTFVLTYSLKSSLVAMAMLILSPYLLIF